MGRPTKLTTITTQAILDVIAAGGTRTVAAEAAGISRGTLYGWLRRGTEDAKTTQTALDPDDYTIRELRALGKTAQIPGYARLRKAELATAIAAKPSEYSDFSDCIKKAEAEAENEWLNGVARIARGAGVTTTVTEELDGAPALVQLVMSVSSQSQKWRKFSDSWQAYAWLLERRHPADWSRRTELVLPDEQAAAVDPLVGVHDELRLARLARQKQQGKSV